MKLAVLLTLASTCLAAPTPEAAPEPISVIYNTHPYQTPLTYSGFAPFNRAMTYAAQAPAAGIPAINAVVPAPYFAHNFAHQLAPIAVAPVTYSANVEPGYVARTPGVEHKAPLPAGSSLFASHHINLQPAA